jgi:predicted Co/Zn/Cd cation transporter (cation efflux family)
MAPHLLLIIACALINATIIYTLLGAVSALIGGGRNVDKQGKKDGIT